MPYGTFPPSERCVRLSPHTAQASQRLLTEPGRTSIPPCTILFGSFDSRLLHYARLRLRSGRMDRSFSRAETPEGSQPTCAEDHVASWLDPYPPHDKAAFACSILLYPPAHQLPFRCASPSGRTTGLPRFVCVPARGRAGFSAGDASSATGDACTPVPDPFPFGASVTASSACLTSRRVSALHVC